MNKRTNERTNDGSIDRRTKERPTKWTAAECCLLTEQILLSSYISESRFFSMIHRLLLHFFFSSSCLLILQKNAVNSMSIWLDIIRIVFLRAHGLRRSRGLYTRAKWYNKCCSKLVDNYYCACSWGRDIITDYISESLSKWNHKIKRGTECKRDG